MSKTCFSTRTIDIGWGTEELSLQRQRMIRDSDISWYRSMDLQKQSWLWTLMRGHFRQNQEPPQLTDTGES